MLLVNVRERIDPLSAIEINLNRNYLLQDMILSVTVFYNDCVQHLLYELSALFKFMPLIITLYQQCHLIKINTERLTFNTEHLPKALRC